MSGKGDTQRPTDYEAFGKNFDRIFGKKNEGKRDSTTKGAGDIGLARARSAADDIGYVKDDRPQGGECK